jgi:transcription termination factor Rho
MLLADLRSMAGGLGVAGAGTMKKAQLVEAIKGAQSGASSTAAARATQPAQATPPAEAAEAPAPTTTVTTRSARASRRKAGADTAAAPEVAQPAAETPATAPAPETAPVSGEQAPADETGTRQRTRRREQAEEPRDESRDQPRDEAPAAQDRQAERRQDRQQDRPQDKGQDRPQEKNQDRAQDKGQDKNQDRQQDRQQDKNQDRDQQRAADQQSGDGSDQGDGDNEGGRRNRRRRGRDRANREQGGQGQAPAQTQGKQAQDAQDARDRDRERDRDRDRDRGQDGSRQRGQREPDTTVLEDDVLVPAAGILDVLDNYAFVRTSGYLPGTDDVYLSLSMVRKFGLRRGDAVLGQVRQPREGERREKFNPMVRIDSVNGADPDAARERVDFAALTPVHPTERLRLETDPADVVGRLVDLAAPIGKGQRGLVVSPAQAGKTSLLRAIASSLSSNNPECHLMVVLVDERPEEITDFERSVKGEVIASSFDRPPADHVVVAELAIERAKRLVELGHDVVVLLDGITRLARAYNLTAAVSGRVTAGGVDPAALFPPKRFFGAARNIEDGGSLTILATALVDSGSPTDEVIFEEFEGTANMELRLRREPGERYGRDEQVVPAVDVVRSGTRRDDLLLSPEELEIVGRLRDQLAALDPQRAHTDLLERLRTTHTNIELLTKLGRSAR